MASTYAGAPHKVPPHTPPPLPRGPVRSAAFVAILAASQAAAAATPLPPPSNSFTDWRFWSTYDASRFDAPAPPAHPPAAAEQRYLLLPLPFGPSHAFVLRRVGIELARRGATVLAVAPAAVAEHVSR